MSGPIYSYVEGADLIGLAVDVTSEFRRREAFERDSSRRPNSLRLVASELFEVLPEIARHRIVADVYGADDLFIEFEPMSDPWVATTASDLVSDLVAYAVAQVLRRNRDLRIEDDRRVAVADISRAELGGEFG